MVIKTQSLTINSQSHNYALASPCMHNYSLIPIVPLFFTTLHVNHKQGGLEISAQWDHNYVSIANAQEQ